MRQRLLVSLDFHCQRQCRSLTTLNSMKPEKKNIQKRIALIWTVLLLILFFVVMIIILVLSGKSGDFSSAAVPVMMLAIVVSLSIFGINARKKSDDEDKD